MLKVKGFVLAAAVMLASTLPASAQELGVGLSLIDDRGAGVIVDYSGPLNKTAGDFSLNWVGDLSFNHRSISEGIFGDYGFNTLLVQGGVRIGGVAGDNLTWHGQALVGIGRTSYSGDFESVCDIPGADCSNTDVIVSPGAALSYKLNEKSAVRGQLDLPLGLEGSNFRFSIMYARKMGS